MSLVFGIGSIAFSLAMKRYWFGQLEETPGFVIGWILGFKFAMPVFGGFFVAGGGLAQVFGSRDKLLLQYHDRLRELGELDETV